MCKTNKITFRIETREKDKLHKLMSLGNYNSFSSLMRALILEAQKRGFQSSLKDEKNG